ncbi:MAG: hydrogenase expression/formation protein HypE [Nitrospiraceae bacterium]|nr:hydrogenase expression/formation protein HypE [Nitrospiraceae bacterium]
MDRIRLGHGSGGKMMHELISNEIGKSFNITAYNDSAVLEIKNASRIAYTTDSYVVSPLFFPGGNIGELAVYGTVNDLAVSGAEPRWLTAGFILEEGFLISDLKKIVASMSEAAKKAGVKIVAGDTKVVNKGKGDGIFINTSGIGIVYDKVSISAKNIKTGDKIIISGEIGNHGISIMAERNGITFDPPVISDTRPLNGLVKKMLGVTKDIGFMRDPTRGGLATTLKEAALESGKCIRIQESEIPFTGQVKGACELLGLDPLYIANEGILAAIVPSNHAEKILEAMQSHEYGKVSAIIGSIEESPNGMVLIETSAGGTRMLDMLQGEQLPRIC